MIICSTIVKNNILLLTNGNTEYIIKVKGHC
nr:MAG TPA: hypothetical protein [Caudoviricetes sp.]